ncbi:hypothetical protein BDP27DRAFT_1412756 [Rhodocollybia butyracea]|uniref:Uncharacterized protein n=1 Tax=Rhodocollybia butyracea TaxID=206335 RepID=A0A9P5QC36_9AGAR|nr:hypothetical protein BDP27DRAFT_1412756 [Rhodocollybia butyracea]
MLCLSFTSDPWQIDTPIRACFWLQLRDFQVYPWNTSPHCAESDSVRLLLSSRDISRAAEALTTRYPGSRKDVWHHVPGALCVHLRFCEAEIVLIPLESVGLCPDEQFKSTHHQSLTTLSSEVMLKGLLKTAYELEKRGYDLTMLFYQPFIRQCLRNLLATMYPKSLLYSYHTDLEELPKFVQEVAEMLPVTGGSRAAFYQYFPCFGDTLEKEEEEDVSSSNKEADELVAFADLEGRQTMRYRLQEKSFFRSLTHYTRRFSIG